MSVAQEMRTYAERAREALKSLRLMTADDRRNLLEEGARRIAGHKEQILRANKEDLVEAKAKGLSPALLDRLMLDDKRIEGLVAACRELVQMPDFLNERLEERTLKSGVKLQKVRVPIGVVAVIFESRPNVTIDAAAICIKSGNASILRGGSEAWRTNDALVRSFISAAMPANAVQLIETKDREAVRELVKLEGLVDLVIPRGGEGLIRSVADNAKVPVIKNFKGVCHVFVHDAADVSKALAIVENAKCQRPGVCNAMETLLVQSGIAGRFLPALEERLGGRVELRCDERSKRFLHGSKPATEYDWYAEYLDLVLAVRTVEDLDEAVAHIEKYGSHHSDAIVSEDKRAQLEFCRRVDSAAVYVNASTRFTDGGEFGLGAEIGISTDRLHARGPMGPKELTTYKYVLTGDGSVR